MKNKKTLLAALALVFLLTREPAAQTVIPSTADVSRAGEKFKERRVPAPGSEAVPAPLYQAPAAAIGADDRRITVSEIRIEGVTAYPKEAFLPLYSNYIGQTASLADMKRLAAAIAQRYRADGYVLVNAFVLAENFIPRNSGMGLVIIRVQEGEIGNVRLVGDAPTGGRNLAAAYAEKIRAAKPLNAATLERYLLLINDLPGTSAQAAFRPTSRPGVSDLVISLAKKSVDAALGIDNRSSIYLGRWQESAAVTLNDIFGLNERTSIRAITSSPTSEMRFIEARQDQKLGSDGLTLRYGASYARTQPGASLSSLDINGKSESAFFTFDYPFLRARLSNLTGRIGFDLRNIMTDAGGSRFSADRLRSLRAGFAYDMADHWRGINIADLALSEGIQGLGSTGEGAGRTNPNAQQDYTKINLYLARTQDLTHGFSLILAASGQYAFDSLLAFEQFQIGGNGFGTAYDPGEISGDHGVAGKAELRYDYAPGISYLRMLEFYSYYDVGTVWRRLPQSFEQDRQSLASAGGGVRAYLTSYLSGNIEVAVPLTKPIAATPGTDSRLYGGFTVKY